MFLNASSFPYLGHFLPLTWGLSLQLSVSPFFHLYWRRSNQVIANVSSLSGFVEFFRRSRFLLDLPVSHLQLVSVSGQRLDETVLFFLLIRSQDPEGAGLGRWPRPQELHAAG